MALCKISLGTLSKQTVPAIYVISSRSASQDVTSMPYVEPSQLKRGTGGRSSFNGYVATVFGATGFVGKSLLHHLGKQGTQIIVPYRCSPDDPALKGPKLVGDLGQVLFHPFHLQDKESIRKAVKYSNVVINLIGRDFETKNFSFEDVHVTGAREIAKACKEAGVKRLIHFSALNATLTPERYYLRKPYNFLPSKLRGEWAVQEEFPDATIFRPGVIYGASDRFLWGFCNLGRSTSHSIPLWKKGEQTIKQPVYVADVSRGVISAMKNSSTKGKIIQIVGPEKYRLSDIVDWCLRVLQKDVEFDAKRHDVQRDPLFVARVLFFRYGIDAFWHTPKWNLCFEQIEREAVTDVVDPDLLTLADLGVPMSNFEEVVPFEISNFIALAHYKRTSGEWAPTLPLKPVDENPLGMTH